MGTGGVLILWQLLSCSLLIVVTTHSITLGHALQCVSPSGVLHALHVLCFTTALLPPAATQERLLYSILPEHIALSIKNHLEQNALGGTTGRFRELYISSYDNVRYVSGNVHSFQGASPTFFTFPLLSFNLFLHLTYPTFPLLFPSLPSPPFFPSCLSVAVFSLQTLRVSLPWHPSAQLSSWLKHSMNCMLGLTSWHRQATYSGHACKPQTTSVVSSGLHVH